MKNNIRIAILFIIINFCVSYVSDNVLSDLSKYTPYKTFTSLAPYFKNKPIVVAGIYAGITVAFATTLLLLFTHFFLNTYLRPTLVMLLLDFTFKIIYNCYLLILLKSL